DGNSDVRVDVFPKATEYYAALNAEHPVLGKPKVWEALKYAIDYQGMVDSFLAGQFQVHQAFWPEGLWAGLADNPYNYDLDKAKALLAEAGVAEGSEITIDTLNKSPFLEIAQSVQSSLSQIGIKSNILTADGKTLWPKYRARKHEMIIARWSPDYLDPHSNADSFAHNPDNAFEAKLTGKLAWRNAWADDEITAMTEQARNEGDLAKREKIYLDLQAKMLTKSPFIIMFQQTEQVASRSDVQGFVSGASFDLVYYRNITK
ncbi:MAG: hypothetical protein KAG66_10885, partial [Methylococcales bacterium]|nr:hypothetical protein [Methylococcales bacterium]